VLARERPGPPVPGQAWDTACALVRGYEFCEPRILRAVYRRGDDLLGRDMLLEGRFFGLRFHLGVRITEVIDETARAAGRPSVSGAGVTRRWRGTWNRAVCATK
jgi:hypothetical protein